jgi:ATP-dependent DNA ligase
VRGIWSRNDKPLHGDFPTVLEAAEGISSASCLIDGEVIAIDAEGKPAFQELQNRSKTKAAIVFYAFDLLSVDGEDARALPLAERREKLQSVIDGSGLRYSQELQGKPKHVAQINFMEWTSNGHLQHASFARMRDDKKASQLKRELPSNMGCVAAKFDASYQKFGRSRMV